MGRRGPQGADVGRAGWGGGVSSHLFRLFPSSQEIEARSSAERDTGQEGLKREEKSSINCLGFWKSAWIRVYCHQSLQQHRSRPEDCSRDFNVRPVELRAPPALLGCTGTDVGWMESRFAHGCGTEWYNPLW